MQVLREDQSGAAVPPDRAPAEAPDGEAPQGPGLAHGAGRGAAEGLGLPYGRAPDGGGADGEPLAVVLEECVLQNSRQARSLLAAP